MAPLPLVDVPPAASTAIANITALRITIYLLQFLLCLLFLHALPHADAIDARTIYSGRKTSSSSQPFLLPPPSQPAKEEEEEARSLFMQSMRQLSRMPLRRGRRTRIRQLQYRR